VIKLGRKLVEMLRRRGEDTEALALETEINALDEQIARSRANLARYDALRATDRAAEAAGPGAVSETD
jgi:hypothetical protein